MSITNIIKQSLTKTRLSYRFEHTFSPSLTYYRLYSIITVHDLMENISARRRVHDFQLFRCNSVCARMTFFYAKTLTVRVRRAYWSRDHSPLQEIRPRIASDSNYSKTQPQHIRPQNDVTILLCSLKFAKSFCSR